MRCKFEGEVTLDAKRHARVSHSLGAGSIDENIALDIAIRAVQLYAEHHPRPTQVNQKQAAEMLDVSARTVHNLIKAGILRLNRCGLIPIEEIDKARA